jgi:hypothetical protein
MVFCAAVIDQDTRRASRKVLRMCIVSQSTPFFYSPFPALPAPKIAGLLPAPKPPVSPVFIYGHHRLEALSPAEQQRLFDAARLLLDVALAHHDGLLNMHALNTALAAFREAVTGQPIRATNPAQYAANMDIPLLQFMMSGGAL